MVKEIRISDDQFDWLQRRGAYRVTPTVVLTGVIALVERIEKDQAKYLRWLESCVAKPVERGNDGVPD